MKKLLKTAISLLLICTTLLLTGCSGGYREERSSRKDREIVAKIGKFEIKYELVRALFHTVKGDVDGGDETLWTSDKADEYFAQAMKKVEEYLLSIYGTFAYAKSIGIDPYGREIDKMIDAYVKTDIDGGYINGTQIQGYGSKDAYLETLAKYYYTDSANRMMYRYTAVTSKIHDYYTQTFADGSISINETVLREFLLGPDVIHVHWVQREKTAEFTDEQWDTHMEEEVRAELLKYQGSVEVLDAVRRLTIYLPEGNMQNGFYLTQNTTGPQYQHLIEVAKWLSPYEVSEVVIAGGIHYVLVGMERDTNVLSSSSGLSQVTQLYLEYRMYNAIEEAHTNFQVEYTNAFDKYQNTILK